MEIEDCQATDGHATNERVLVASPSAPHIVENIRHQRALVKTIKNTDWIGFAQLLAKGTPFRTSLTLPPPRGRGMSLFGRVRAGVCGLCWDLDELDLADPTGVFCWPSNYNAKTEHNMIIAHDGSVGLIGGREERLTTIEALRESNIAHLLTLDAYERRQRESRPALRPRSASEPYPVSATRAEQEAEEEEATDGEIPSLAYNEISLRLRGTRGLHGVFVRSHESQHVVFALGVRSMLAHVLPDLPALPLLRIHPSEGTVEVSREELLTIIRHAATAGGTVGTTPAQRSVLTSDSETSAAGSAGSGSDSSAGCSGSGSDGMMDSGGGSGRGAPPTVLSSCGGFPVDLRPFPELSSYEQLALHAAHGVSVPSLASLLQQLHREHGPAHTFQMVEMGMRAAARAGNAPSVRELVRVAAPLMLTRAPRPRPAPMVAAIAAATALSTYSAYRPDQRMPPPEGAAPDLSLLAPAADEVAPPSTAVATVAGAGTTAAGLGDGASSASATDDADGDDEPKRSSLVPRARRALWDEDMLVALGAQIALNEFVAGRTTLRLESARSRLTHWLDEASRPSCTSMLFRLRSWYETRQVEPESELHSFVCGRAISNRSKFLGWLTQLQSVSDGHEYVSMLYALVADLRKPCLRMRMLQDILGLDERFSRDITFGVVSLAYDVVETMARGGPAPPDRAHGLDLDGFSEAARLEADVLFRVVRRRSSDPVGESRRHRRVLCDLSRH